MRASSHMTKATSARGSAGSTSTSASTRAGRAKGKSAIEMTPRPTIQLPASKATSDVESCARGASIVGSFYGVASTNETQCAPRL